MKINVWDVKSEKPWAVLQYNKGEDSYKSWVCRPEIGPKTGQSIFDLSTPEMANSNLLLDILQYCRLGQPGEFDLGTYPNYYGGTILQANKNQTIFMQWPEQRFDQIMSNLVIHHPGGISSLKEHCYSSDPKEELYI